MNYIAVSDMNPGAAQKLAQTVGAQFASADNDEIIARPEVTAVIVSTSEGEHLAPVLRAIDAAVGRIVFESSRRSVA